MTRGLPSFTAKSFVGGNALSLSLKDADAAAQQLPSRHHALIHSQVHDRGLKRIRHWHSDQPAFIGVELPCGRPPGNGDANAVPDRHIGYLEREFWLRMISGHHHIGLAAAKHPEPVTFNDDAIVDRIDDGLAVPCSRACACRRSPRCRDMSEDFKAGAEIMLASTSENSGFYIRGRYELQLQLATDYDARRAAST
jgi:hypothetical protein